MSGHPWIIPGQVQYPPPPFRVSADALVCQAIHGSSPDKCNTHPPFQSIRGCPSMSGHPWIIPGQVQYPPPPFRVSADALVCQAIHGSSPDKCNTPPPPFRVSADALVCRAIHGSSLDKCNTPPPPFQSIRGCPSMSGHPWIIPGQVQYPPPPPFRVSADALVCQAIHGSSPDKCNNSPPPFRVSADALVCRAIHGSSV